MMHHLRIQVSGELIEAVLIHAPAVKRSRPLAPRKLGRGSASLIVFLIPLIKQEGYELSHG